MGTNEKNDKNNQEDSERIDIKSDELKSRINNMMNLVKDDDDMDDEFVEELNKPKKKKFFGLF